MPRRLELLMTICLSITLTVGCGVTKPNAQPATNKAVDIHKTSATTSIGDNSPFTIKINQDLGPPAEKWDAQTVKSSQYSSVQVLDQDGKSVTLRTSHTPLFFEAYWCPHCQRTLVLLNANKTSLKQLPTIISTGFAPGTSIQQAAFISHQEFNALDLHSFKVYYLLNRSQLSKYVVNYPTLIFQQNGHIERMAGEHTLNLWERALS